MAGTPAANTGAREDKPKGGREKRERRDGDFQKEKSPYTERVVFINRVAKVVKGGRRFSFTALIVVGDGKGMVGVGYGKAKEVPQAIAKAVEDGKKNFFKVPLINGTIPHPVQGEKAAGVILLRPLECAGITDVLTKSLGSGNPINMVHATAAALKMLENPTAIAARRGRPLEDVAPAALTRLIAEQVKVGA